jgi:hypothetical protein
MQRKSIIRTILRSRAREHAIADKEIDIGLKDRSKENEDLMDEEWLNPTGRRGTSLSPLNLKASRIGVLANQCDSRPEGKAMR